MSEKQRSPIHQGAANTSPYPVSRLAPAFDTGELAAEVAKAETMLGVRTEARLRVIADQIRHLQQQAREVLDEARKEQLLNRAQCSFKRIPGHIYHLYRRQDGASFFSMLSPEDWHGAAPHEFLGSYRLEADYSWTAAEDLAKTQAGTADDLVERFLGLEQPGVPGDC